MKRKRMKRMRYAACLFFMCAVLIAVPAGASADDAPNKMVKEYSFTASEKPFFYDAPKIIEEGGVEYTLKNVEYKETGVKELNEYKEKIVSYSGLTEKIVPVEITEGGITYTLSSTPKYESQRHAINFKDGKEPEKEITVNAAKYPERKLVTATLENVSTSTKKKTAAVGTKDEKEDIKVPFTITGKFIGQPGVVYVFEGMEIDLGGGASPAWQGSEEALIKYFSLPEGSEIISAKWNGDYKKENGETVRYATFSGMKPDVKVTTVPVTKTSEETTYYSTYAYYTYFAEAVYTNGVPAGKPEYSVSASAEYEARPVPLATSIADNDPVPDSGLPAWAKAVIASAAAAIVIFAAGLLWFLIRRRKKREQEAA